MIDLHFASNGVLIFCNLVCIIGNVLGIAEGGNF